MEQSAYSTFPKIELHLHLDCSLSYKVIKKIDPAVTFETFRETFIAPPKCNDLADYLSTANHHVNLMQTSEALRLVTLDLFDQLLADHVIYAEIRFAPLLHVKKALTPPEVVQIVNEATREGIEKTGIQAGLILCTLRHFTEEQSMETVKLVDQFSGSHVVGFDIAGDEAGHPIDNHRAAFDYANEKGLNITAHAGEASGAESVRETLNHFHPVRLGHGVRSVEDPKLLDFIKRQGIHLEVCPTSNIQTDTVDKMENHPADKIYRQGVSMGINTDARTISNTTLTREYRILHRHFGWGKEDFKRCNLEAIEHAFTTPAIRAELRTKILAAYR